MTAFGDLHDVLATVWDQRHATRSTMRIVLNAGTVRVPVRIVGYDAERNEVVLAFEEK